MPVSVTTRSFGAGAALAVALVAAYAVGTGHGGRTAHAESSPATSSRISVSGLGQVSGKPDVLDLDLSVSVRRSTVDAALSASSKALDRVRSSLRQHDVAAKDIQTSGLSIQPNYTYSHGAEHVSGYYANQSITVKLRDLARAGRTITDAVAAGGNVVRIDNVSLDISSDSALLRAARNKAFSDAKAKAQQYADDAGQQLGALSSISERVSGQSVPYPKGVFTDLVSGGAAAVPAPSVPIDAGTQSVSVTVTAVWSLR